MQKAERANTRFFTNRLYEVSVWTARYWERQEKKRETAAEVNQA